VKLSALVFLGLLGYVRWPGCIGLGWSGCVELGLRLSGCKELGLVPP